MNDFERRVLTEVRDDVKTLLANFNELKVEQERIKLHNKGLWASICALTASGFAYIIGVK